MTAPRTTADDLGDIAEWVPLVAELRTSHSQGGHGGGDPAEASPLRVGPAVMLDEIHAVLVSWVMLVNEETEGDDWPNDYTPDVARWLAGHLGFLLSHPASKEFRREVRDSWAKMRSAIGASPRGYHCPACDSRIHGRDDQGERVEELKDWRWAVCSGCGLTFTFHDKLAEMCRLNKFTVAQYADEIGQHRQTVWRKVKAAGLAPIGRQGRHPVYARDALVALYDDTPTEWPV